MKLLRLALPFLGLLGTTACFGAMDDQGSSAPSASIPSPTSTPTPNVDDPAKPKPTDPGKGDIYAHNGRVRAPVNCRDRAELSKNLPYEIDTNTGLGRWMSEDPAYPFVEGTEWGHFDPDTNALYTRR
jgi:hypothetical protein